MLQFLTSSWQDFWQFYDNTTINWIETPRLGDLNFTVPLYALLMLFFVICIITFRPINKYSTIKAYIISCIAIGILFALRMDYTWFKVWVWDQNNLSSKSVYERQVILLPPPSPIIIASYIKETVQPIGAVRIYSNQNYFKLELKYYLLPVEVSDKGAWIVVYQDDIVFDAAYGTLTQEGQIIAENVRFVTKMELKNGVVYIYQIKGSDK